MESETHVIIIWETARKVTDELFKNIEKKFEIRDVYEITWTKENFLKNLKKFYGITLPDPLRKIKQVGTGPFLLLIILDKNPTYAIRKTSLGKQLVNTNIYDAKRQYRKLLNGGFSVHGSIHEKETNHNLTLLLRKNLGQISKEVKSNWNGEIKKINEDLMGINGWDNLNDLFFILNNTINYVVLRNFEGLPDKEIDEKHEDIDILTDENLQIPYILGRNCTEKIDTKFPFVKIGKKFVKFDVKYVGDTYLDEKWSKDILKRKVLTKNRIFVPSSEDHFYSLLHHIVVQGTKINEKYKKTILRLSKELKIKKLDKNDFDRNDLRQILDAYMKKNGYRYTYSLGYRISHNELLRLSKVAIRIAKSDGISEVLRAAKGKLQRIKAN